MQDPMRMNMTAENLNIFGQCPIEIKPHENITPYVDAVIDSSRYYVVRIKDPKSERTTLIGIGFRERETAFDFKTALNEYVKYIDRMDLASKMALVDLRERERTVSVSSSEDEGGAADNGGYNIPPTRRFSDAEEVRRA